MAPCDVLDRVTGEGLYEESIVGGSPECMSKPSGRGRACSRKWEIVRAKAWIWEGTCFCVQRPARRPTWPTFPTSYPDSQTEILDSRPCRDQSTLQALFSTGSLQKDS